MTDDDLERTLRAAFDAQARASVGDGVQPPPPRFATAPTTGHPHRRWRFIAPLAAAAAVVGVGVAVTALHESPHHHVAGSDRTTIAAPGPTTTAPLTTAASFEPSPGRGLPVHIKLANADGAVYGVGMPVIAYFSKQITDGVSLSAATTITVNGRSAAGAWYFERSTDVKGYPVEGHLRLEGFWPAHAKIHVALATKGITAGKGLAFDDAVTVDFATGAAMIARVDDATHTMRLTEDGKPIGTYPVSLGQSKTPTSRGTKVIMQKLASVCMHDVAGTYYQCGIKDAQRLTYDGEYLHAAPWNTYNITHGIDSSNGCTNLQPADAQVLYKTLRVGDVVEFPNANGPAVGMSRGYADWDVPWSTWQTGGLVPTH